MAIHHTPKYPATVSDYGDCAFEHPDGKYNPYTVQSGCLRIRASDDPNSRSLRYNSHRVAVIAWRTTSEDEARTQRAGRLLRKIEIAGEHAADAGC